MAFSAGTIWENWTTGATTNGGGFDPTNANFLTDLTTDSNTANTTAPVVSSASYNFAAGDVGAWLFIQSGTNWIPGWYIIASVASNKATLTATIGTAVLYGTSLTGRAYHRPEGLNTVAGCATVGTPTGGVWAIDYSQQASARFSYTDIVIDGTTNTDATSAAFPFGKQMLGNILNVASGTGFTVQRVQLVSIPSGVVGRFDKSLGTLSSTGGTGSFGGAIGSSSALTALTQAMVAGNKIFIKATATYALGATTTTVTASAKGDTTSGRISVEGYATYRGERDGRPIITSATNSIALFTLNDNDFFEFIHLNLTHTAGTRGGAFSFATSVSTPFWLKDSIVDGCLSAFVVGNYNTIIMENVEIKNCTSAVSAIINVAMAGTLICHGCDFHDQAIDAFRNAGSMTLIHFDHCIFDTNAIAINITSTTQSALLEVYECTFVDNSSDAIKIASTSGTATMCVKNNVFYNNGGYGINQLDTQIETDTQARINRNNAYGANNPSPLNGLSAGYGDITLTADPFTNKAGRDFTPNNTAGGGAALRAAGFPTTFPAGTMTNHRDVGAIQHQEASPTGGGGGIFF